jgi:uncharacterized protein (TIGR03435 family)
MRFANAMPTPAQLKDQDTTAALPKYEYDVISVKRNQTGKSGAVGEEPDGFTSTGYTVMVLIRSAFGVNVDYQIADAPAWLNSRDEKYDVEARMDSSVADALKKLSPEERKAARRQMLLRLLADRFKLVYHTETRELPIYTLVIGKNGSKLHEAKPGDAYENGLDFGHGPAGAGSMFMGRGRGGSTTLTGQAIPISTLVANLSVNLGRPVLDKTGLKGDYDFMLNWIYDDAQPQAPAGGATSGQPPSAPSDSDIPTLVVAVEEQLGLKLAAGKGPVEVFMIDHVERPSGN